MKNSYVFGIRQPRFADPTAARVALADCREALAYAESTAALTSGQRAQVWRREVWRLNKIAEEIGFELARFGF
jgi:hypothetical protein